MQPKDNTGIKILIAGLIIVLPILAFFIGSQQSSELTLSQTASLNTPLDEPSEGLIDLNQTPDLGLEPINPSEQNVNWERICELGNVSDKFTVEVNQNQNVAAAAKQVIKDYLSLVAQHTSSDPIVSYSSAEQTYAEDFVRKELQNAGASTGGVFNIPCLLAEEAVVNSLKLKAAEEENLRRFGGTVDPSQLQQWVDDIAENSAGKGYLEPQSVGF